MRAGIDIQGLVWLVVILASIVGQMVKTAKKHRDAAPMPGRPADSEPPQELEDFLRNLMGDQAPRSAPPRPPPAPAPMSEAVPDEAPRRSKPEPSYRSATTSPTVASRPATAEPPVIVHRPARHAYRAVPAMQPPPRPSPVPVRSPPAYSVPSLAQRPLAATLPPVGVAPPSKAAAALRDEVRRQVKTPGALRSALLMREILGPPVGLRDMSPIR